MWGTTPSLAQAGGMATGGMASGSLAKPKPKFATDAEEKWYAMMQSKLQNDELYNAQQVSLGATGKTKQPEKPKPIASPHRPAAFRVPGTVASASAAPRAGVAGHARPVAAPAPRGGPPRGAPIPRGPPQPRGAPPPATPPPRTRVVNSLLEAKPHPGQFAPARVANPEARPPPPLHPASLMRKLNGLPPARPPLGRPPPSSARPSPGRAGLPAGQGPSPEALRRLRAARGPKPKPPGAPTPSKKALGSTRGTLAAVDEAQEEGGPSRAGTAGSRLAQRGAELMADPRAAAKDDATTMSLPNSAGESGAAPVEWVKMWDEQVESHYYYNERTGEASWIRPDDLPDSDGEGTAALAWDETGSWDRYWDDEAGAFYMHNPETGDTRWAEEGDLPNFEPNFGDAGSTIDSPNDGTSAAFSSFNSMRSELDISEPKS